MAEFKVTGPNGKNYIVEAPDGSNQKTIESRFYKDMGWTQGAADTTLNQARVVGTAAVQGVTDVANIPSFVVSMGPAIDKVQFRMIGWMRELFGMEPLEKGFVEKATEPGRKFAEVVSGALDAKAGVERIGLPTDPKKEAERLGVEYTPALEAVSRGTRMLTGSAAMGVGRVASLAAGTFAGAGTMAGGEIGSLVGAPETGKDIGEIAGTLVGPGVVSKIAQAQHAKSVRPPELEKITIQSKEAYKKMEDAGVVISQPAMNDLAVSVSTKISKEGFYAPLHTKTDAAMKVVREETKTGMSLEKLDQLRQVIRDEMKGASVGDRRLLRSIVSEIDDFGAKLAPGNVIAGDPSKGIPALMEARELWSKKSKAEFIDTLVEDARTNASTYSAAGFQKALKDQFKSVAKNPAEMRMFAPEEREAILRVARGGPVENILRQFGRLAPQNLLSAAAAGGLIGHFANLETAGAVAAGGMLAREASKAKTRGSLRELDEMVRRGAPAPIRAISDLERQLLRSVIYKGIREAAVQEAPPQEAQQ